MVLKGCTEYSPSGQNVNYVGGLVWVTWQVTFFLCFGTNGSIPTPPYILPGKYYEFRFSYESSYSHQ